MYPVVSRSYAPVTPDDVDPSNFENLSVQVRSLLARFGLSPPDCIVTLDFCSADLTESGALGAYVLDAIHRLQEIGLWGKLAFQATNYPTGKNPIPEGGTFTVRRAEIDVWRYACEHEISLRKQLMFGDYGADHGEIRGGGGRGAIPHLRYARLLDWRLDRGDETWASIRDVAKRIADSGTFMGERFSVGDETIADLAAGLGGTGGPTDWRRTNMNHHLTVVAHQVGTEIGEPYPERETRRKAVQVSLFQNLEKAEADK